MKNEEPDVIDFSILIEDPPEGINETIGRRVVEITGSIWFAYIISLFIILWMLTEVVQEKIFDGTSNLDFPVLMTLMTIVQVLLPSFILVGQVQQIKRENDREEREREWRRNRTLEGFSLQKQIIGLIDVNRNILRQLHQQQEAIVQMEKDQGNFNRFVSSDLISAISSMSESVSKRPCMLDDLRIGLVEKILKEALLEGDEDADR